MIWGITTSHVKEYGEYWLSTVYTSEEFLLHFLFIAESFDSSELSAVRIPQEFFFRLPLEYPSLCPSVYPPSIPSSYLHLSHHLSSIYHSIHPSIR